jgi:hypothetical protein
LKILHEKPKMMDTPKNIKFIFVGIAAIGVFCSFFFPLFCNLADASMGPLKVHPTNPRYFADGDGKAIYLTGSHVWYNLQDRGNAYPPPAFDFNRYLIFLKNHNHNFIRLWTWELTSSSGKATFGKYWYPKPWPRSGPGTALDGLPKFDLSNFNQAYFDRLRKRVIAARDQGIYVSIMLFEGWGLQFDENRWAHHPFNISNNINNINGDSNGDSSGTEIHQLKIPAVTAIQEAYVRKVIDTVNDLDNVLFEICNEDGGGTMAWQEHFVKDIRNYEKSKPKQHPVGITPRWDKVTKRSALDREVFKSSADWISPINTKWRRNPPANNGGKVIISDTDHLWGIGGSRDWVWKSFTRGLNPIFMDPYDNWTLGINRATAISIRKAMGHTLYYAKRVNMTRMLPKNSLASTEYCLAHVSGPGLDEYIAYIPSGNSITMNLSNSSGMLNVEWFNTVTGTSQSGGIVQGGASRTFTAPFSKAVLILHERPTK